MTYHETIHHEQDNHKVGLFIGRFQPGHYGHIDAIKRALSDDIGKLIIGIGSSNKEHTSENPFDFQERKEIVSRLVSCLNTNVPIDIVGIPDFGDERKRYEYIIGKVGKIDVVFTGNPRVGDIFAHYGVKVCHITPHDNKPIKASHIRRQLAIGNYSALKNKVPLEVIDYLKEIGAAERMKHIFDSERIPPSIAVDLIIRDQNGKYLLITRKNEPHGIALVGGFVGYGESTHQAGEREGSEELGGVLLEVTTDEALRTFSSPDRDPRGHVTTHVYEARIVKGIPQASDDAESIVRLSAQEIEKQGKSIFAFPDHYTSIMRYEKYMLGEYRALLMKFLGQKEHSVSTQSKV